MRLQEHVGDDHLVLQLGVLSLVPRVLVRAEVVPGPAVEAALLDARDVVGHEVVAQPVALVHRGPELAGLGCVARPTGLRMPEAKTRSFLPSGSNARMRARRASRFVVVDVRARADRDVQGLAVGRELQVARPVPAAADRPRCRWGCP